MLKLTLKSIGLVTSKPDACEQREGVGEGQGEWNPKFGLGDLASIEGAEDLLRPAQAPESPPHVAGKHALLSKVRGAELGNVAPGRVDCDSLQIENPHGPSTYSGFDSSEGAEDVVVHEPRLYVAGSAVLEADAEQHRPALNRAEALRQGPSANHVVVPRGKGERDFSGGALPEAVVGHGREPRDGALEVRKGPTNDGNDLHDLLFAHLCRDVG